jgi:hypothetical protein
MSSDREKRQAKVTAHAIGAIERMCQVQLGKSKAEAEADGAKFGGGAIVDFRKGWATIPFNMKPHYWRRRDLTLEFTALCGFKVDQTNYHPGAQVQFAPGGFWNDRCKVCARKARTQGL